MEDSIMLTYENLKSMFFYYLSYVDKACSLHTPLPSTCPLYAACLISEATLKHLL